MVGQCCDATRDKGVRSGGFGDLIEEGSEFILVVVGELDGAEQCLDLEPFLPILGALVLPDEFVGLDLDDGPVEADEMIDVLLDGLLVGAVQFDVLDGVLIDLFLLLETALDVVLHLLILLFILGFQWTILQLQVLQSLLVEILLVIVVILLVVMMLLIVNGVFLINEGGVGRGVLLGVALVKDAVDEGWVETARAHTDEISESDILETDAHFIAVEHVEAHALGNVSLEDEGASNLGELPVDEYLEFLEFLKAGVEVKVVFEEDGVGKDGPVVPVHELEDVDGALLFSVVVLVRKGEDLIKGKLFLFLALIAVVLQLVPQVVVQLLSIKADFFGQ